MTRFIAGAHRLTRCLGLASMAGLAAGLVPVPAHAAGLLDACTGTGLLDSTPLSACGATSKVLSLGSTAQAATGALTGVLGGATGATGLTPDLTAAAAQAAKLANAADTASVDVGELRGLTAELGNATAASLGGGSAYNPVLGTVTLPNFQIRGTTYANVGAALDAVDVALRTGGGSDTTVSNGQGYATNVQINNVQHGSVQYDRGADGTTLSSVTLNSDAGGPVLIHNLAPGVGASDAATVGQVQAVANSAVQYTTINGVRSNTVMLSGGSPGGVTIGNLAPGVAGTDAVNVSQLQSVTSGALSQANSYTDGQIGNLRAFTDKAIASARRDGDGGTALALAATGIRFDDRPGKYSVGGATSYYNGQVGLAFGVAGTSETGRVRVNAAISASPTMDHPSVGGVVGASVAIN